MIAFAVSTAVFAVCVLLFRAKQIEMNPADVSLSKNKSPSPSSVLCLAANLTSQHVQSVEEKRRHLKGCGWGGRGVGVAAGVLKYLTMVSFSVDSLQFLVLFPFVWQFVLHVNRRPS